jgi:hypothetical protein
MARNKVQFQKGLSEVQFASLYGTEDQCREAVMRWRWPSGFVCPVCGGKPYSLVKTRALYQCTACRRTSLIAGTIFAATKVPRNRIAASQGSPVAGGGSPRRRAGHSGAGAAKWRCARYFFKHLLQELPYQSRHLNLSYLPAACSPTVTKSRHGR